MKYGFSTTLEDREVATLYVPGTLSADDCEHLASLMRLELRRIERQLKRERRRFEEWGHISTSQVDKTSTSK